MIFLDRFSGPVLSLFRMVIGFMFLVHGTASMFGVFGGNRGTGRAVEFLAWPSWWAALIQVVCGGLVMIGLFSRAGATLASGSMAYRLLRGPPARGAAAGAKPRRVGGAVLLGLLPGRRAGPRPLVAGRAREPRPAQRRAIPKTRRPGPGLLRDLVAACLGKDPAGRPIAEQVFTALLSGGRHQDLFAAGASAAAGSPAAAMPPPAPQSPPPPPVPPAPRSHLL